MALNNRNAFSHSSGGQTSEIKVWAGVIPSGGSERESIHCLSPSFWGLLGIPWHSWAPMCITPIPAAILTSRLCVVLCQISLSFLLGGHLSLHLGPIQIIQDDLILRSLTSLHLQRPFFQIRSPSQVLGIRTWTFSWGTTIQSTTGLNSMTKV